MKGDAMKTLQQTTGLTLSILLLAALCLPAAAAAAVPDGKALFLAQKCNMCHNVPTAGIEKTMKTSTASDLVNVKGDAATVAKVLKKQADVGGKKHPKEFKGTDEELNALVAWILAQKK
jgi:cytochrome c5